MRIHSTVRNSACRRCIAAAALALAAAALPAAAGSIVADLERALVAAGPDDLVPVVVLMEEFPDRRALLDEVRPLNRADRRAHVIGRMKALAGSTQRGVHEALGAVRGEVERVRVLWGVNGVSLRATPRVIERLARLPGVRWVLHDHGEARQGAPAAARVPEAPGGVPPLRGHASRAEGSGPTGGDTSGPNPDATVAGEVVAMGARQVWDELGYTGAGVIVGVIDTGIDRTHPDLADHIWTNLGEIPGNAVDDDGNGYVDDTWGWEFCADNNDPSGGSHGTQVAGQLAGDGTDGTVTGMAPDVEMIALGIDCDTPSRAWEASDYAIAAGAHILTQSYSWWWEDQPDYEAFRRQTDTELAAGVIHVNSAGNGGTNPGRPIPYNISAPANSPPPWLHPDQALTGGVSSILAAGNISWTTDVIDPSSSLGPAAWEDIIANTDPDYPHAMPPEYQDYPYENGAQMGLIKPDLSAYGSGTTTTCPGPFYCGFSGTSSAAPHVAGTLALMLESNQEATPAELAEAIMTTAEHRGDPGKNNVYGTGLVRAFDAVSAIESGVVYVAHAVDDAGGGNGDLAFDPGETVVLSVTVESRTDTVVTDLEAILSSRTPGVTVHDLRATFPALAVGGTATSDAPHFSVGIDPAACAAIAVFDLELRYQGRTRRASFEARIGDVEPIALLDDGFEVAGSWTSDPGTTTRGAFVREDPIGVTDGTGTLANPEDDTSDPGVTCWVTGNGELTGKKDENNNDVDGGSATLTSPVVGVPHILSATLSYDRWYYDNSGGGDSFVAELSNDGGMNWTQVELLVSSTGGWETTTVDPLLLLPPSDEMRLRFVVTDGAEDSAVEGAVDEVHFDASWVNCQDHVPPAAQPPNPVGPTLLLQKGPGSHVTLAWSAPPVDATHDAATLYRVLASGAPGGTFPEAGSATSTSWFEIDGLIEPATRFFLVEAENAGGTE